MGVERNTARFFLQARANGGPLGRTLTIGRQNLFLDAPDLAKLVAEFGFSPDKLSRYADQDRNYVEPFLKEFGGATEVESVDVSSYEGATHIHDLNYPIPEALKNRFDTVIDAGSLEHILNFPQAIRSLMEAVKVGGRIFIQTPANNYFGHGFYQFSAELFYRVFSAENGFVTERMVVFEHFFPCHFFRSPWYEVNDPRDVGARVQLVNKRPLLLMVQARKTENRAIFEKIPQQSDYVTTWQQQPAAAAGPSLLARFKHHIYRLPLWLAGSLWLQYKGSGPNRPSLSNRRFFRKLGT